MRFRDGYQRIERRLNAPGTGMNSEVTPFDFPTFPKAFKNFFGIQKYACDIPENCTDTVTLTRETVIYQIRRQNPHGCAKACIGVANRCAFVSRTIR